MRPPNELTIIRKNLAGWKRRAEIESAYRRRVAGQFWNPAKDKAFPLEQGRIFMNASIILPEKGWHKHRK